MKSKQKLIDPISQDTAWEIETKSRPIYVIGDLHGDLNALITILAGLNLINPHTGDWVAQDTILITMGDHVDRGGDSRGVLDLLLLTESTSSKCNSESYHLLGNHEIERIQNHVPFLSASDRAAFNEHHTNRNIQSDYPGDILYIDWFRRRNTILKAEDSLFVHAGLGNWATTVCPSEINAAVCRWLEFFTGIRPHPPDESTSWVLDDDGPLYIRENIYGPDRGPVPEESVKQLSQSLEHLRVRRLVVGHTAAAKLILHHDQHGEKLVMVDTAIYRRDIGVLSALKIEDSKLTELYFDRPHELLPLTLSIRAGILWPQLKDYF
jgi:hypothetical protein